MVEDPDFSLSFTATSTSFPAVLLLDDGNLLLAGGEFREGSTLRSGLMRTRAIPASVIVTPVASKIAPAGASMTLSAGAGGVDNATYKWLKDGNIVAGETASTLAIGNVQPGDAGLYTAMITNPAGDTASAVTILGLSTTDKVVGAGSELEPANIVHPNGNLFDQVLLTGAAETITADANQVTRTSFIDLHDDIVQIEFSGAGTLSVVLDNSTGPAPPVNYNQPTVSYMKGHGGIVITGANETTNVSVFTVGRATAFDFTGGFDFLQPISATNNPANNGSPLFAGHETTNYDGIADIAFIAISTTNGKFGGVRTSNASYFATKGYTGIYAPGVAFQGPVFMGDISASDAATPVIMIGSSPDTRITGGDLFQANGEPVNVSGLTQLKFTAGGDSHGKSLSAKMNRAVLLENGVDVTTPVVVNPAP